MSESDGGEVTYSSAAGRWVIAGTVLGSGMASIDATVVGIALPTIGRQMHASLGTLEWVVSGYTLTLAALLLPGGALGDRYGRRRVFVIGVAWFVIASALCAAAPGSAALIATRVLQGIGAALLTPGSLAIIQGSFTPDDRGRAVGAWSGLGGVATAAGPLVGGYLIAVASWRWIFLINVPLGLGVLLLSARHIPESRDEAVEGRLDLLGAGLAVVALAGIVYGLIEGPARGWSEPDVVWMLIVGTVASVGFVRAEAVRPYPMMPLEVLRVRQFTATNAVTFVVYSALGGALFLLPVMLQVVDRYSPLSSGLSLLPLTAVMFALSARSGRLAARIGPRLQMTVGPVLVGAGLLLLDRATTDRSYISGVLPAVLLFGLGLAATVAPLTITALSALPAHQAGLASAFNNDVARLGSLIAVAVLPALAGIAGHSYLHPAELAHGFRTAAAIAGAWCAFGGVLAAVGIRNPPPARAVEAEPSGCLHCALDATPLVTRN
jgi:EmrB/QacA subfamily drug resistance transporter